VAWRVRSEFVAPVAWILVLGGVAGGQRRRRPRPNSRRRSYACIISKVGTIAMQLDTHPDVVRHELGLSTARPPSQLRPILFSGSRSIASVIDRTEDRANLRPLCSSRSSSEELVASEPAARATQYGLCPT
jgi:hypothetical protein